MIDCNSDEENDHGSSEIIVETNNSLQNETHKEEQRTKPKLRVEITTPNRNLIRNNPLD